MLGVLLLLLAQVPCAPNDLTVVCSCKQGVVSACDTLRLSEPELAAKLETAFQTAAAVEAASRAAEALEAEGETSPASPEPPDCTGQLHHIISKRIAKALQRHRVLRGHYKPRDPRFVSRAVDEKAHCGYQDWHRDVDDEVIEWIESRPNATPKEFEAYLREVYRRPDMLKRFPVASESSALPRFFVLKKGETFSRYDADAETVEPVNLGDAPCCPRCGDPIGMLTWLPPYRAQLVRYGEELGDFIKASGNELLLSERFAQAFREEGLTGLEGFHPVEVVRVRRARRLPKHSHLPKYVVVRPCFGRAAVDLKRSTIQYAVPPTCEECRSEGTDAVFGFTLEPGTWQGEDVFFARGLPGVVTVSERFERLVARHGFTNMRLTPTEQYVWNPLRREPPLTVVKPDTA